jgi:hypothetical protein
MLRGMPQNDFFAEVVAKVARSWPVGFRLSRCTATVRCSLIVQ